MTTKGIPCTWTGGKRHDFEGEQLTVKEIRARVPALGEQAIRVHLAAGRNTRVAMLSWNAKPRSKPKPHQNIVFALKGGR